jgi:type II secretory pathway component PulL
MITHLALLGLQHHTLATSLFHSKKYGNTWALWVALICIIGAFVSWLRGH